MFDNLAMHYEWWMLALLLIAAEVMLPGFFMLWIGIAAALVGVIMMVFPELPMLAQTLLFAALAFLSCGVYWKWIQPRFDRRSDQPHLNRRAEQLIGRYYNLETAIVNGRGKARIGDSLWLVEGPDLPVGSTIKVTAVDGSTLKVKAVE